MRDMFPWVLFALVLVAFVLPRFVGKTSSEEAHRLVAEGAVLVDVRTVGEYSSGHIEGAINIPVAEIARRSDEIGPKEQPVVVYCHSGSRSAAAASTLRSQGFTVVEDLGGMSRW